MKLLNRRKFCLLIYLDSFISQKRKVPKNTLTQCALIYLINIDQIRLRINFNGFQRILIQGKFIFSECRVMLWRLLFIANPSHMRYPLLVHWDKILQISQILSCEIRQFLQQSYICHIYFRKEDHPRNLIPAKFIPNKIVSNFYNLNINSFGTIRF